MVVHMCDCLPYGYRSSVQVMASSQRKSCWATMRSECRRRWPSNWVEDGSSNTAAHRQADRGSPFASERDPRQVNSTREAAQPASL
ncbi:hypothetical protein C0Q70_00674 [Pomacea canaliculata]|uniref:Uncharacterized protein n=1 Tax=Pomacea canaliculata TaxID=400727 RepID=A0A2T7PXB9_POMCA|nr:hypothetical protein C0Q70_00674 [Pomacea canaliculata]